MQQAALGNMLFQCLEIIVSILLMFAQVYKVTHIHVLYLEVSCIRCILSSSPLVLLNEWVLVFAPPYPKSGIRKLVID